MKLLQSGASPFARKARVTVIESGLSDRVTNVPVVANMAKTNPDINVNNPLGKIPCLILDDATPIFDSRAICRYLDAHGSANLYPENDWKILSLESLGDGIMECAVAMVYEKRLRPPEKVFPDFLGWQWEKISRALESLENSWIDTLRGDLTVGHVSVACALGYLDFRLPDRGWRQGHERLEAWEAEFSTRPSLVATAPTD